MATPGGISRPASTFSRTTGSPFPIPSPSPPTWASRSMPVRNIPAISSSPTSGSPKASSITSIPPAVFPPPPSTPARGKPLYAGEEHTRDLFRSHEWLAQVLFYTLYSAGGFPALVLFRAADLTLLCAIVGFLAYRRSRGFYRSLGAALLTASVALSYTSDRPFLVSFLLLAPTLLILELRRPLWLLPLLFALWSNCHGDFVLGWAAMGAYCAEALLLRRRGKPDPHQRRLWICCALAIAASGLNPNGFRSVQFLLASHNSLIQSRVWEWKPPTFWPPQPFNVILVLALAVLLLARRRVRPADWILFGLYALATIMAARNLMLTGIVGPI